jgi:dTDP-4-dehydrorhamnose reductase
MRILIAGARGMLGTDLLEELGTVHQVTGLGHGDLDITDAERCRARVFEVHPEIVINAAAMTDVDGCESREQEAFLVNGQGAGNLAAAATAIGSVVIHFSTDYIFDGTKDRPYCEEDKPNPRSVYGKSKLAGEQLVRTLRPDHLILRTSWVFGSHGKNFIRTIAQAARRQGTLRVVNDQRGSPTYTIDLARYTRKMLEARCRGTYHLTNSGSCTWYELAARVVEWLGLDVPVLPVASTEYRRPASRPANSVLANGRLAREGFPLMRPWQEAAEEYVKTGLQRE